MSELRRWESLAGSVPVRDTATPATATPATATPALGAGRTSVTVTRVGRLIVIEGLDGAGKRTLTEGLTTELRRRGYTVARTAFPRYATDVHADLVAEALRGGHGDLADSVYGMAVLYALDRRDAAADIRADLTSHDVVIVDRYVASNAAYGAARLRQDAEGEFIAWQYALEVERFALPRPDLQILLQVPVEVAASRAHDREQADVTRQRDRYESDSPLQRRCSRVYSELAEMRWWSSWLVVDGVERADYVELAELAVTAG